MSSIIEDFGKVVSGFVEKVSDKLLSNIPAEIISIILSFYLIVERFTDHGDKLRIDETNSNMVSGVIIPNKSISNTVYGNNVIDKNDTSISKYIWGFKYSNKSSGRMVFGIDVVGNKYLNKHFIHHSKQFYSICLNDTPFNCSDYKGKSCKEDNQPQEGVLYLTLDMIKKELSFKIEGTEGIIATEIDMDKYFNLAVGFALFDFGLATAASIDIIDSVEMICFKIHQN